MSNRTYSKLHINKNREEGSEKIIFGYQYDGKEVVFKKDEETYFHVGSFASPVLLKQSDLAISGATGGPFPAASDRIFKSKKNFGNSTHHGTPLDNADGVWYCSWLFRSESGVLQWLDRFYNPGNFSYTLAEQQLFEAPSFSTTTSIFRDIPSRLAFEPGVLYKYFHSGETNAATIENSFAGLSSQFLLLDLSNWGDQQPDKSSSSRTVLIKSDSPTSNLYYTVSSKELHVNKQVIEFNKNYTTKVSVDYEDNFNPTNEFTVSFWAYSDTWNSMHTTQLFGNYSSKGGYGVFIESPISYPFFVISETFYGHLLYINEDGNGYFDKSIQIAPTVPIGGAFSLVDENQNVIVCPKDNTGLIYKLDHTGKLLASSKTTDVPFEYIDFTEEPLEIILGSNSTIKLRTKSMLYTFDEFLNAIEQLPQASLETDRLCYIYNTNDDFHELVVIPNSLDAKAIETTVWTISSADGNLYRKTNNESFELFYVFEDKAEAFSIDPFNNLWVLHGLNNLTVIDTQNPPFPAPVFTQQIKTIEQPSSSKKISFFASYNRKTNEYTWKAIVCFSNHFYAYIYNLSGELIKTINLLSVLNPSLLVSLEQDTTKMEFVVTGDFTGYEYKRVFNQLFPIKNKNRISIKASLKDGAKKDLIFKSFVQRIPLDKWEDSTWQFLTLTYKNKTFSLYSNSSKLLELSHGGRYGLSYELQPLFFLGCSGGSQSGFNEEVKRTAQLFVGKIADIKIYDYAIDETKLDIFLKSFWKASDVFWALPSPSTHYLEKVERLFKNKIPGSKSILYKIKIRGSGITDESTKNLIATQILQAANDLQPGHSDFYQIDWID